jgi:hypothetical protein
MYFRYLYSFLISYDGSFQLVRKNKSSDRWEICLSDGTKYFVEQRQYREHLERSAHTGIVQSAKVSTLSFTRSGYARKQNKHF